MASKDSSNHTMSWRNLFKRSRSSREAFQQSTQNSTGLSTLHTDFDLDYPPPPYVSRVNTEAMPCAEANPIERRPSSILHATPLGAQKSTTDTSKSGNGESKKGEIYSSREDHALFLQSGTTPGSAGLGNSFAHNRTYPALASSSRQPRYTAISTSSRNSAGHGAQCPSFGNHHHHTQPYLTVVHFGTMVRCGIPLFVVLKITKTSVLLMLARELCLANLLMGVQIVGHTVDWAARVECQIVLARRSEDTFLYDVKQTYQPWQKRLIVRNSPALATVYYNTDVCLMNS